MASEKILGISLGTRKSGIAIMDCYSIFDCSVKTFPGRWSASKKQSICDLIERYIINYQIGRVAIKMPKLPMSTPALAELLAEIEVRAKTHNVTMHLCTIIELKTALAPGKRVNKKEFMEQIAEKYPELQKEYEQELKNKGKHYEKMFEAVAATLTIYPVLK